MWRQLPNSLPLLWELEAAFPQQSQLAVTGVCSPLPPGSFDGGITHQHPSILHHSAHTAAAAKICQEPILLQIYSLKGLEETGVAESTECYSRNDPSLQSMGVGGNQGLWSYLGKCGQPYQSLLGQQAQLLFSDGKVSKAKTRNSLLTHATRQKITREPLVLRCTCCKCGWGRFEEDLSFLGRG